MRGAAGWVAPIVAAGLVAAGGWNAAADWNEGDPAKWVQGPDLRSDLGLDVNATAPAILADDFLCRSTGPITNVHLWASWWQDQLPTPPEGQPDPALVSFTLTFHTDIPSNQSPTGHSMPGPVVWQRTFNPGEFEVRRWAERLREGWYAPEQQPPLYEPEGDTVCWQYNFTIDPSNAFVQAGGPETPVVYWLNVQARPAVLDPLCRLGWKTSTNHWNDDATWGVGEEPYQGPWNELRYPPLHPLAGQSIDLAFALEGGSEPQPELDFGDAPDPLYPTLLGNNGARHVIGGVWLGLPGNQPDADADGQPHPQALGDDFDGNDDEDGVWFPNPMMQGKPENVTVHVGGGGVVEIWLDLNGDGAWQGAELLYNAFLGEGTHSVALTVPTNAIAGSTFARCRISLQGTGSPVGLASDGEVEDHNVFIANGYVVWCNLQWPPATTTLVGVASAEIYGQVWDGWTSNAPGPVAGMIAQLGYGPDGSSPVGNPAWVWTNAVFNVDFGNNDEYKARVIVASTGRYDYAYRFSKNGIQWSYGDLNGSQDGYQIANAGDLTVEPYVPPRCEKWRQPPDCEYGLNLQSVRVGVENLGATVADDWLCDGRPITAVRWWGSYIGWTEEGPPPGKNRPTHFELTWYTDWPAGEEQPYSKPSNVVATVLLPLLPSGVLSGGPGDVVERWYCRTDLRWTGLPGYLFEDEYEYEVQLPTPWLEKEGTVYWLSVRAVYDAMPTYLWGWKTTAPDWNWNDDAVVFKTQGLDWEEMRYPPPVNPWSEMEPGRHPYATQSVNMAFSLLTDVCPRRAKKWSQAPDMVTGVNMPSFAWQGPMVGGSLRADDFVSDGRRITDIHWWGSYLGWQRQTPPLRPVPPPTGLQAPVGFWLSWHADIPRDPQNPESFSQPSNPPLARIFVPLARCREVFYGSVWQPWAESWEHEYQYYVNLLEPDLGVPWVEQKDVVYWLDIQAVFDVNWRPDEGIHQGWGWKTTHPANQWNDVSVVADDNGLGGAPLWRKGAYPTGHPFSFPPPMPMDLAFELTTDEVGEGPWYHAIAFTNISGTASNAVRSWSVGDWGAGMQYLQRKAAMTDTSWVTVATNPVPFPWPYPNTWIRPAPLSSQEFYRVLQR